MSKQFNGHRPQILLVEDNLPDARLTQEAFNQGSCRANFSHVRDGDEALQFLHQDAPYQQAVRPDLILLDLNLPKRDGREVLRDIKANPRLRSIPVIVLTTSDAARDLTSSYDAAANCYVRKPLDLDGMYEVAQSIKQFWFSVASLPD